MSGRPTPRSPKGRPSTAATALVCLLVVGLLLLSMWLGSKLLRVPTEAERRPERVVTHDSLAPTYTYDGEVIRWYVLSDPDTGIQYLVNDRGGCAPRLDRHGSVMGVDHDG